MVTISQGEVWWVDLPEPQGAAPGFRRPMVVVQSDLLNHGRISTVICVAMTTNLKWATAIGNVLLPSRETGLPKDSVANVSSISTVDKANFVERVAKLHDRDLQRVLAGINLVLGR